MLDRIMYQWERQRIEPPMEDDVPVHICQECGEDIYEGYDCFFLGGEYFCEECVRRSCKVAERED